MDFYDKLFLVMLVINIVGHVIDGNWAAVVGFSLSVMLLVMCCLLQRQSKEAIDLAKECIDELKARNKSANN